MNLLKSGKSEQSAPLVGMVAIVMGALGLYFWVTPLQTFRPPAQEEPKPPLELGLPGRLWQDPIQEARESVIRPRPPLEPVPGQEPRLPKLKPDDAVLAVTVYGGYGQLDHETRLRSRYAVEQALTDEGYTPDGTDTEWLRFLTLDWTDEDKRASRKVVPFEWWNGDKTRNRTEGKARPPQVLVLWIDDAMVGSKPRSSLRSLLEKAGVPAQNANEVRMIGPTSSSGLKDLIAEREPAWPRHIYSPWATADEVFLFSNDISPEEMRLPSGIDRTIATDRQACGKLLDELEARRVRLRGSGSTDPDDIAVLSEWDTVYGRALPVTFAACVLAKEAGQNCGGDHGEALEFRKNVRALVADPAKWPEEVVRVSYLRGLDGVGPRSPGQATSKDKENKPSFADMERPDGTSQLDYARRLADRLVATKSDSLRAVGVLGGDIYDKLLLLQALRGKLPGAFFFTTDLDAGYLHPTQNEWSRNLLVASGFGLSEIEPQITPPFRDAYGVAIRRAVRRALSGYDKPVEVSVYEIGRTAAYGLDPAKPSEGVITKQKELIRNGLWLLLLLLLAGVLLTMQVGHGAIWWWLAGLGFLLAVLTMLFVGRRYEPILWLEGISIWPTEIIRLIAVAATAVALFRIGRSMRENLAELTCNSHFASQPKNQASPSARWLRSWRQLLAEAPKADAQGRVEAQSLWHCYGMAEEAKARWWRAGSLAIFILVVVVTCLGLDRPMRPCRGSSCNIDALVAGLSIAAMLLLTCYVADATATCTRWIRCMIKDRTIWPEPKDASAVGLPGAWLEVEIVARRTQVVGHMILYPFALLLLLIIARFPIFDRWPWPPSLVITFAILLGLAMISALALRWSAEELREKSYAEVRALWVEALQGGGADKVQRYELAMKNIEAESRGSFSPFTQNPVLAAIMLPLSGAGTGLALEKLLQNL